MQFETISFSITGTKRLLMRSGRMADPLDPISRDLARLTSKRPKTEADHRMIGKTEWYGSLWLHDGRPCIPAEALMATFYDAAKTVRGRKRQAEAGLIVEHNAVLEYDGPRDIDALWEDGSFSFRAAVRVGANSKTMRTRPCFANWSTKFTAKFLPSMLDREQVFETYVIAGQRCGLGDWHPQNGTFQVELLE